MFALAIPEDAVAEDSEDEEKVNPDERLPQQVTDKRIAPDNEFSDSEDEGSGGRRDNRSFKGGANSRVPGANKRPRIDNSDGQESKPVVETPNPSAQPTPDSKGE